MTARIPTAEEFRNSMCGVLWNLLDTLAARADLESLDTVSHLLTRIRPAAGEAAQFRERCLEVFLQVLQQPDVRAQVRQLAADPKRAKRHRRMLELVLQHRSDVFTEATTEPVDEHFLRAFDKYVSGGWIETTPIKDGRHNRPPSERVRAAEIRERSAASYLERRHILEEIAENPKASKADRARARAVLRKYGGRPNGGS